MSRIAQQFEVLGREGRKGFIPFVTMGDPDLETSVAIILKLAELGADVIELGVPFSDPVADGPTIQRSSQRALSSGTNVSRVIEAVRRIRSRTQTPLVVFSYLNPLFRYGTERFVRDAADAGIDGVLITDVVDEEAADYGRKLAAAGLDLISLVAPTTSDRRLEQIAARSSGFIYAVSRAGVTGARSDVSDDAEALVERCRNVSELPVAVGFGISTAAQVAQVWRYADAAVVGSAIVSAIEKSSLNDAVTDVDVFVRGLLPTFAKSNFEL